jgi:hypothetical protein
MLHDSSMMLTRASLERAYLLLSSLIVYSMLYLSVVKEFGGRGLFLVEASA